MDFEQKPFKSDSISAPGYFSLKEIRTLAENEDFPAVCTTVQRTIHMLEAHSDQKAALPRLNPDPFDFEPEDRLLDHLYRIRSTLELVQLLQTGDIGVISDLELINHGLSNTIIPKPSLEEFSYFRHLSTHQDITEDTAKWSEPPLFFKKSAYEKLPDSLPFGKWINAQVASTDYLNKDKVLELLQNTNEAYYDIADDMNFMSLKEPMRDINTFFFSPAVERIMNAQEAQIAFSKN